LNRIPTYKKQYFFYADFTAIFQLLLKKAFACLSRIHAQRLFLGFPLILFFLLAACSKQKPLLLQGRTMGTTYHIKISDLQKSHIKFASLQQKVDSLLKKINMQMSTYIPGSEISRFNRSHALKPFKVTVGFMRVLKTAIRINKESGGAFDVTVAPLVDLWGFGKTGNRTRPPSSKKVQALLKEIGTRFISVSGDTAVIKSKPGVQLDFSAIAKGYGVDAVTELLKRLGFANFMVEIGGEVRVKGKKGSQNWKIGIDRPITGAAPGSTLEGVLNLQDMAAATSGDYRNYFLYKNALYSHEINPRNGQPIQNGVASVTVLAPNCMLADAMATAIMVMGAEKGLKWVDSKKGIEAMVIVHNGKQFIEAFSSGFKKYFQSGSHNTT